jgi:hypothetical protein
MTPHTGPVSIRCRRVYPPLLREWGPMGAPSTLGEIFFSGTSLNPRASET